MVGAHARLGYVHYREGRYADAVQEYLRELAFLGSTDHVLKDRTLIELHQKLGAAYLRLGQTADADRHLGLAIRSFEERVARGADDPATKYYAAIALRAAWGHGPSGQVSRGDLAAHRRPEPPPRGADDPDFESVRPALAAKGLLD